VANKTVNLLVPHGLVDKVKG